MGRASRLRLDLLCSAALVVAVATGPAGSPPAGAAGLVPPSNSLIVGSGSQATFATMQQLSDLFDQSLGCNLVAPPGNSQPLDFSCPASANQTYPPLSNGVPQYGYTENPLNDVATQEPPLGSNNGILQLEDQGVHGTTAAVNVADNISYATNARNLAGTDLQGLNFVAYAEDGVSWLHFTDVNGVATPSANVTNLTKAQLQKIFEASSVSGAITNWSQVGGSNAPIDVFSAQEGSATLSTWKSFLGFDPSSGGAAPIANIILQNEDRSILAKGAKAAADAIFYFPTGLYAASCKQSTTNCGGSPLPPGDQNALGKINGVNATQATILNGTFPVHRYEYNVYSNGSNHNIPEASAATLNFVSEDGFLCKPQLDPNGKPIIDPNTGLWYHSEIENIIAANGFIPLPNGVPDSQNTSPGDEGQVPHTAYSLLAAVPAGKSSAYGAPYLPWAQPTLDGQGNPTGYCLVSTTDGNASS